MTDYEEVGQQSSRDQADSVFVFDEILSSEGVDGMKSLVDTFQGMEEGPFHDRQTLAWVGPYKWVDEPSEFINVLFNRIHGWCLGGAPKLHTHPLWPKCGLYDASIHAERLVAKETDAVALLCNRHGRSCR